jgi:hypothetical protein
MIGPTDVLHPSPAPHFRIVWYLLIYINREKSGKFWVMVAGVSSDEIGSQYLQNRGPQL